MRWQFDESLLPGRIGTSLVVIASVAASPGCTPNLVADDTADTCEWSAPANTWPAATPPCLQPTGYAPGDVVPDFRLGDQFGDEVALWQFWGRVVAVDVSTMWCRPCQAIAESLEGVADDYAGDAELITVLSENTSGDPPVTSDLVAWTEEFGIDSPVVGDPEGVWSGPVVTDGTWPVVLILDRQLRVARRLDWVTEARLRESLDAAIQ